MEWWEAVKKWWKRPSVSDAMEKAVRAAEGFDGFQKDWTIADEMEKLGWKHNDHKGRAQDEKAYDPC